MVNMQKTAQARGLQGAALNLARSTLCTWPPRPAPTRRTCIGTRGTDAQMGQKAGMECRYGAHLETLRYSTPLRRLPTLRMMQLSMALSTGGLLTVHARRSTLAPPNRGGGKAGRARGAVGGELGGAHLARVPQLASCSRGVGRGRAGRGGHAGLGKGAHSPDDLMVRATT